MIRTLMDEHIYVQGDVMTQRGKAEAPSQHHTH